MPRKKEKRPSKSAGSGDWSAYWSRHPEEKAKHEALAKARNERARLRRLAKHQPELTDIQSNGKWVDVTFIRNGELVYGTYILKNLQIPSNFQKLEDRRADRFAARVAADEAREKRPPEPGKTPRS